MTAPLSDPTAILCGRAVVLENVFIGPYAVIRADEVDANGHMEAIVIGAHSNIQDVWSSTPSPERQSPSASGLRSHIARSSTAPARSATVLSSVSTACSSTARWAKAASWVTTRWSMAGDLPAWALRPFRTACRTPHRPRHHAKGQRRCLCVLGGRRAHQQLPRSGIQAP